MLIGKIASTLQLISILINIFKKIAEKFTLPQSETFYGLLPLYSYYLLQFSTYLLTSRLEISVTSCIMASRRDVKVESRLIAPDSRSTCGTNNTKLLLTILHGHDRYLFTCIWNSICLLFTYHLFDRILISECQYYDSAKIEKCNELIFLMLNTQLITGEQ